MQQGRKSAWQFGGKAEIAVAGPAHEATTARRFSREPESLFHSKKAPQRFISYQPQPDDRRHAACQRRPAAALHPAPPIPETGQ